MPTSGQARRGEAFRIPPGSKDSNGKEESSGAAGSLLGYFYEVLFRVSLFVYNLPMSSSNIFKIIIALIVGIALGLIYGWVIEPVEYTDVTPNILREDYRADYVLMVAEAHQNEQDPETAARLAADRISPRQADGISRSGWRWRRFSNWSSLLI